jgi:hypothetical protein
MRGGAAVAVIRPCGPYTPPAGALSPPGLATVKRGGQLWVSDVETSQPLADAGHAFCGQMLAAGTFVLYPYHANDNAFPVSYALALQNPSATAAVSVDITNAGFYTWLSGQPYIEWQYFYAGHGRSLTVPAGATVLLIEVDGSVADDYPYRFNGQVGAGGIYGGVLLGTCSGPLFVYDYCWRSAVAGTLAQVPPGSVGRGLLPARGVGAWNLLWIYPFGRGRAVAASTLAGGGYTFRYGFTGDSFGGADVVAVTDQQTGLTYTYNGNYPIRHLVTYGVHNDTGTSVTVKTTVTCVDRIASWPLVEIGQATGQCALQAGEGWLAVAQSVPPGAVSPIAYQLVNCGSYPARCAWTLSL